ncbi:hypothetical protein V1505DRAFT_379344, partial [Lipomyces doorenjongii]
MTALSDVFPTAINQLCRWHIEQNILKNCRKYFTHIITDSVETEVQERDLNHFKGKFPVQAVNYFLELCWIDGKCERCAEIFIRKNLNFGMSTTSRVEGSHCAMKGALNINRSEQLSIRNQIETAQLCTAISRPSLELVYAEVIKKLHLQIVEGGTEDTSSCSIWHRYLLPCLHRIQLGTFIISWKVYPVFRPLNINWPHIDPETLSNVEDPQGGLPRKGRPRGT